VDCLSAVQRDYSGCSRGYLDSVYYYATQFPIAQEKYYRYSAIFGKCDQNKIKQGKTFKINSYVYIYDCLTLVNTLLNVRPIAVTGNIGAIWYFYQSGVIPACGDPQQSQGLLLVGASSDATTNVLTNWYKFKNCWGTAWGEKGYVRVYRDPNDNINGPCNICKGAIYTV
jgi:hypothetical protein